MLEETYSDEPKSNVGISAKLPKLQITKFNGQFSDWLRFWNQFTAIIDSQNISPITKFSYLKEHLDTKVKRSIDGLPFTEKGYDKAKAILVEKYANESEIVNSYVEEIISLPTVNGSQVGKIHSFYEKLRYNVQSLETLSKLSDVNGYVRMTLNKLPNIRGDLVRTDTKWKEWTFSQLCEALREWTKRNPVENNRDKKRHEKSGKAFNTQQRKTKQGHAHVYIATPKSIDRQHVQLLAHQQTGGKSLRRRNYAIIAPGAHTVPQNVEVPPLVRTVASDTIRPSVNPKPKESYYSQYIKPMTAKSYIQSCYSK